MFVISPHAFCKHSRNKKTIAISDMLIIVITMCQGVGVIFFTLIQKLKFMRSRARQSKYQEYINKSV